MANYNLDQLLAVMRTAEKPIDNVMPDSPLNKAFLTMMHSVAAFIDATRADEEKGYAWGRQILESMTHAFPLPATTDAVQPLGNGLAAVNLDLASDDDLREVAAQSGMSFETLKQMQALRKAAKAKRQAQDPHLSKVDWAALEAQFKEGQDNG